MKLILTEKSEELFDDETEEYIFKSNYKFKKKSNFNRIFKKFIINCIVIFFLLIGRKLYIRSLKGCSKTEFECLHNLKLIKDGINNCLNSTVYFIFALFLIHMKICSFFILFINFLKLFKILDENYFTFCNILINIY